MSSHNVTGNGKNCLPLQTGKTMADKMTEEQRHYCMSRIRSVDTRPEMVVRKFLHASGFRYSLHRKDLPGSPDIVLKKYHTVIFINGCFWHGHPLCRYATVPKTNSDFWTEKIRCNKERDANNIESLERLGWHAIVVWECELKPRCRAARLELLETQLRQRLEPEAIHTIPNSIRKLSNDTD